MEQENAPKIVDVARVAGVSTATVSRALSKPETVAKSTREAVLAAAAQTGYRINVAARNLRRRRTGAVVVLVPNLGNPFFSQILAGIEATLSKKGLSILMVDTMQSGTRPDFIQEYLHHTRADGVIVLDGSLPSDLLQSSRQSSNRVPLAFGCEWHPDEDYPSVRADNEQGARLAIEHLVELGHEKIGYINGPHANVLSKHRLAATKAALAAAEKPINEEWFFEGDFTMQAGVRAARRWLDMKERPTGLFCANDETAIGLISELHQCGINVPDQLSIVGFDDVDIAQHYIPTLTTIWQPRLELGKRVAQMLVEGINQGGLNPSDPTQILPVKLRVRNSTAPPGSAGR
ncbi:MAG: LacI family DNA-binding transcriptional regulator [Rhizobiaceae bacterium]